MNTSYKNIEHPGIITRIEGKKIWVKIQPQSSCGNCHSKAMCGMAEVAEKIVEATSQNPEKKYFPGQQVIISLQKSLGYKALFLGYLLPFLLLMITLVISLQLTSNETLSALLSIGIMIPYYAMLYSKRDAIKSSFRFFILE